MRQAAGVKAMRARKFLNALVQCRAAMAVIGAQHQAHIIRCRERREEGAQQHVPALAVRPLKHGQKCKAALARNRQRLKQCAVVQAGVNARAHCKHAQRIMAGAHQCIAHKFAHRPGFIHRMARRHPVGGRAVHFRGHKSHVGVVARVALAQLWKHRLATVGDGHIVHNKNAFAHRPALQSAPCVQLACAQLVDVKSVGGQIHRTYGHARVVQAGDVAASAPCIAAEMKNGRLKCDRQIFEQGGGGSAAVGAARGLRAEGLQPGCDGFCHARRPPILVQVRMPACANLAGALRVGCQRLHQVRQVLGGRIGPAVPAEVRVVMQKLGVIHFHQPVNVQQQRVGVSHKFCRAAPAGGNAWHAHRHRFHVRQAPALAARGQHKSIGSCKQRRHLVRMQVAVQQNDGGVAAFFPVQLAQ